MVIILAQLVGPGLAGRPGCALRDRGLRLAGHHPRGAGDPLRRLRAGGRLLRHRRGGRRTPAGHALVGTSGGGGAGHRRRGDHVLLAGDHRAGAADHGRVLGLRHGRARDRRGRPAPQGDPRRVAARSERAPVRRTRHRTRRDSGRQSRRRSRRGVLDDRRLRDHLRCPVHRPGPPAAELGTSRVGHRRPTIGGTDDGSGSRLGEPGH